MRPESPIPVLIVEDEEVIRYVLVSTLEEAGYEVHAVGSGGKGTGLGLSVSFGIIKDHGGEITLDSVVGQGTTFYVRLPALGESVGQAYESARGA